MRSLSSLRRFLPLLLILLAVAPMFLLVGCSTPQYASVSAAPAQQYAPQYAQPQGACYQSVPVQQYAPVVQQSACSQAAPVQQIQLVQPATQLIMAQPTGVKFETGAPEVVRTGLAIPGNVVMCFGNFLRCSMEALFPTPTPSMSYTYAPLAPAPAPQYFVPRQAPYCAPVQYAPAPPPQAAPLPQKAPGCEPPAAPPSPVACVGRECLPPGSR